MMMITMKKKMMMMTTTMMMEQNSRKLDRVDSGAHTRVASSELIIDNALHCLQNGRFVRIRVEVELGSSSAVVCQSSHSNLQTERLSDPHPKNSIEGLFVCFCLFVCVFVLVGLLGFVFWGVGG